MSPTLCPDRLRLRGFALGTIVEAEAEEIAEHLESCPVCEATVEMLDAGGDTLVQAIRQPAIRDPHADDPDCRAVEKLVIELDRNVVPVNDEIAGQSDFAKQSLGQYQLLELIGSGGMGSVYRAVHSRLQKVVALKLLSLSRTRVVASLARFQREMLAVGQLDHPHIVRATDAGEADGRHFLVMEFLDGRTLSEILETHGPLAIADACELIRQAALGLQEVHEHGMVHRDIKPSNLMLARGRQPNEPPLVKLLDLGLALLASNDSAELTQADQVMGTLDYMAPEQAGNTHAVDIRADIFGLGATLYRLLTGERLARGEHGQPPLDKLAAIAQAEIEPVESLRPDVSAELASVVQRLLAKSPAQRFETPRLVAEALQPFCDGHQFSRLLDVPESDQSRLGLRPDRPRSAMNESNRSVVPSESACGSGRRPNLQIVAALVLVAAVVILASKLFVPSQPGVPVSDLAAMANRRAIAWALDIGGSVFAVRTNQRSPGSLQRRAIKSADDELASDESLELLLRANPRVTDASLESLRGATAIVRLELDGTPATRIAPLATLANLHTLKLGGPKWQPDDLRPLRKLTGLSSLTFGGDWVSVDVQRSANDELLAEICQIRTLKSLQFGSRVGPLTNDGLQALSELPQLERLNLLSAKITDEGLPRLARLTTLRTLILDAPQLTSPGQSHLAAMTHLEELRLYAPELDDSAAVHWRELRNLSDFGVMHCRNFTGAEFPTLPKLSRLTLHETHLDDPSLRRIVAAHPHLTYLSVASNPRLSNAGLSVLRDLKSLSILSLSGNQQLTDGALDTLEQLPPSVTLYVQRTGLSREGVSRLRARAPDRVFSDLK